LKNNPWDYQHTFLKHEPQEGKNRPFPRYEWRGEGIRKRVNEGECGGYILYSYVKIEE
jgi:hypothetical protein